MRVLQALAVVAVTLGCLPASAAGLDGARVLRTSTVHVSSVAALPEFRGFGLFPRCTIARARR